MTIYMVEYGEGPNIEMWSQTTDVTYADSYVCLREILAGDGHRDVTDTSGSLAGPAVTFTDGTPTGDVTLVRWRPAQSPESSSHEWCGACGDLVLHGSDDGDTWTCDGTSCSAPTTLARPASSPDPSHGTPTIR